MHFDFSKKFVLENEFVRMRPLEMSDFEHLLEFSLNEPELWRFNADGANGEENLKIYISNTVKKREEKLEYPFIVFDKRKNKFVGSTRFNAFDFLRDTVELGYTWYGKETHGDGTNKNCKYLMLEFAFEQIKVERVGFRANNANKRSINAMKSIGCVVEGIFRNYSLDNYGNRMDVIFLSILKNEWFGNVKENLRAKIYKE